jgi:hypothetical protein
MHAGSAGPQRARTPTRRLTAVDPTRRKYRYAGDRGAEAATPPDLRTIREVPIPGACPGGRRRYRALQGSGVLGEASSSSRSAIGPIPFA